FSISGKATLVINNGSPSTSSKYGSSRQARALSRGQLYQALKGAPLILGVASASSSSVIVSAWSSPGLRWDQYSAKRPLSLPPISGLSMNMPSLSSSASVSNTT